VRILAPKLVFQDAEGEARWGLWSQRGPVGLVGGWLGRRRAVWIWLVSCCAGNYALRREENRTKNVRAGAIITLE
jgi:hypothetical protein